MKRLTESLKYPLTTFKRCQLCGFESGDICEFRMWFECDDADKPELDKVLVACEKTCNKVIDEHERLYKLVPWGNGYPGIFMLLCGDCKNRGGNNCTHKDLKCNGGKGLKVDFEPQFGTIIHISYTDGTGSYGNYVAVGCEGKE